jgi:hypothetical protein
MRHFVIFGQIRRRYAVIGSEFVTPHIIRTKSDLCSLALDERQKLVRSLGRKEIHDVPASQIHELYKPSFSIPVPPAADLNAPYGIPPKTVPDTDNTGPGASNSGDTPFNTTEIQSSP